MKHSNRLVGVLQDDADEEEPGGGEADGGGVGDEVEHGVGGIRVGGPGRGFDYKARWGLERVLAGGSSVQGRVAAVGGAVGVAEPA